MSMKTVDLRQQTGFRADRTLLNEFRSRIAHEGRDMSTVIEGLIIDYMVDSGRKMPKNRKVKVDLKSVYPASNLKWNNQRLSPVTEEEVATASIAVGVVRAGGAPASILRLLLKSLSGLIYMENRAGETGPSVKTDIDEAHQTNSARHPLTDDRIAAAERVATELDVETKEARSFAGRRPANGAGTGSGGGRLAGRSRLAG